jgi:hypothetical protein
MWTTVIDNVQQVGMKMKKSLEIAFGMTLCNYSSTIRDTSFVMRTFSIETWEESQSGKLEDETSASR